MCWVYWFAWIALAWYITVLLVIAIGVTQLYRNFSKQIPKSESSRLPVENVPHVTVIRPIVGTDPYLYECLASTFIQIYPASKLSVHFCIPTRHEPSLPILKKLLHDFPTYDARIYIAEEDPILAPDGESGIAEEVLGPNPKIRNMSRAYREAKGDIIWIIDCNVWVGESVAGHMVDRLCGFGGGRTRWKYKFAHQIPLAVDVSDLPSPNSPSATIFSTDPRNGPPSMGNRLEEMFLSTSHAKFYTAISTVAIAPCTVGKSNMFRRSHLDALTPPEHPRRSAGIDFFSENICEDHLISDLLWRSPVPPSVIENAKREGKAADENPDLGPKWSWGNHALLLQPPCIQPVAGISLPTYAARRSRWLRVRKFTVPAATAVEPGTESFVATAGAAFALTTLPYFKDVWGLPQSWLFFGLLWLSGVALWAVKDWFVWGLLQSWEYEGEDLAFVGQGVRRRRKEGVLRWFSAWLGREILAFPVWAYAILGGVTVVWRGKRFWVGLDMKVHEIKKKIN